MHTGSGSGSAEGRREEGLHCRARASRYPGVVASEMNPTGMKPVDMPVSSSRTCEYSSLEYLRISVDVSESDPNVTIRPAACQVVPEVIWSRSSNSTSVQPSLAR